MTNDIRHLMKENPGLRKYLFVRGYLIDKNDYELSEFPFYGSWNKSSVPNTDYFIYTHKALKHYSACNEKVTLLLVGHAMNPFDMVSDEQEILERLLCCDELGFTEELNKLSGVFTLVSFTEDRLTLFGDCATMQCTYYSDKKLSGKNECFVVSSHFQLIADLYSLKRVEDIDRLVAYKHYSYYGNFLPGDLSAYENVFRLVPNTYVKLSENDNSSEIVRFYPICEKKYYYDDFSYDDKIKEIARILKNTLSLTAEKWNKPAISMSGGMDSKCTLACANGDYDKFNYYSFISLEGEVIDEQAAKKICNHLGLEHKSHIIEPPSSLPEFEQIKRIMTHNYGEIGAPKDNDVVKRAYFFDIPDFDVEIKSWVSEVGRANYYKKFGKKKMPKHLNAKQMACMYKLFALDTQAYKFTVKTFKDYIGKTAFGSFEDKYDESDMYLWEFRYGSWGGLVITCEHRMSYDITIPYNNRVLMDMFLSLPLEKRISDQAHYDIIKYANKKIDELGITVTNYNETKKRMIAEKIYFDIRSRL